MSRYYHDSSRMRAARYACLFGATLLCFAATAANGAELVTLTPENWDRYVPQGKEVDAIYGDYVLRNDRIVAVIGRPGVERHANLTVKSVGGALLDLTSVAQQNDQLSAWNHILFLMIGGRNDAAREELALVRREKVLDEKSCKDLEEWLR